MELTLNFCCLFVTNHPFCAEVLTVACLSLLLVAICDVNL